MCKMRGSAFLPNARNAFLIVSIILSKAKIISLAGWASDCRSRGQVVIQHEGELDVRSVQGCGKYIYDEVKEGEVGFLAKLIIILAVSPYSVLHSITIKYSYFKP